MRNTGLYVSVEMNVLFYQPGWRGLWRHFQDVMNCEPGRRPKFKFCVAVGGALHSGELVSQHDETLGRQTPGEVLLALPKDLHPASQGLVQRFAEALAAKLRRAELKYGYEDGWAQPGWMNKCRKALRQHIPKGDPLDVAAYCAFLWHHGASTAYPERMDRMLTRLARKHGATVKTTRGRAAAKPRRRRAAA